MPLLPQPQKLRVKKGHFPVPGEMFVVIENHVAVRDLFAAERFVIQAESLTDASFRISVGQGLDSAREIRVRFANGIQHEQGYQLVITDTGIEIRARSGAGAFYGFQTLTQILREAVFTGKGKN